MQQHHSPLGKIVDIPAFLLLAEVFWGDGAGRNSEVLGKRFKEIGGNVNVLALNQHAKRVPNAVGVYGALSIVR